MQLSPVSGLRGSILLLIVFAPWDGQRHAHTHAHTYIHEFSTITAMTLEYAHRPKTTVVSMGSQK